MAKGKNKLNKTNSSGWLDDYSEELSINEYQEGGKVKDKTPNKPLQQYFKLPTKRVAVDNTYNKNSPKVDSSDDKEMVNRLLREKANESQKAKEKRIADVRRLEELNRKSMLETANAKDLYDIGEGMKSKYRFSNEDNFFDDYINPFNIVGGMAGGLAQTPELINQGDYTNAALSLATPLTVGALAGIGTQNIGQFTNNLVNPLAGMENLIPSIDKNINKFGFKNYSNISDKLNNTLNNVDYEISTVLKKLDPFYQKKINQELISANQWQNDWYNNFKTRKRIENLSEEINNDKIKTFEGINIRNAAQRNDPEALKDFTQDELNSMFPDIPVPESFPSNDWDKILDRINNKNYLSEFQTRDSKLQKILKGEKRLHEGNDGISGYFLDDTFKGKRQNFVNKYANNVKSTAIHEGNHGLTDGNELIPFKERKNIVKIFGDDAEIPKKNSAQEFNTVDEYLQNPTEVYARIMELRKDMGLKPGEILENDKFFNIMEKGRQGKTPVDSRFFELIKNPNEFKNLFNRLPTAALPIGIGAASQLYNGQEKEINQYPDGGFMPKAQSGFIKPPITLSLVPALYNKFFGKNNPVKANVKKPSESFLQEIPSTIKPTYESMREDYFQKIINLNNQLSTNDSTNYNMSNAINLTSGRFKGAAVSPELINEAVQSAKAKGIDPWLMLSVIGRESTFGSGDIENVVRKKSKRDLLSGWNVSEPYEPYDPLRFFADKKAPGISVKKSAHGWIYDVNDKTALNKYLTQHPELVAQYQQKISATPLLGDQDSFDLAAKMIKEKGLKNYNAGDPKYLSMVNQDMQLLKSDSKLKEYMEKLGYQNGGEITQYADGGKINNDMKKKVKKYPAGGYLDYQEGFKGFGVGPQLYQDNSYFRSIMPDTIENMEEEINKPSVFSGINDVLGGIDQVSSQGIGLISNYLKPLMNKVNAENEGGAGNVMSKSENPEDLFMENYKNALVKKSNPNEELDMTGIEDFDMPNLFSGYFNPSKKNGGYINKYQNGGEMDMLPVGSPEYIHKSNVFHENYNPVPRVHFTDDTTPFDMGVNLNDLVNMNGGRINKYQNGGDMSLQGYFNYLTGQNQNRVPSRAFNSNTNRASLGALESANANDFLNTKMRNDRQAFEDDKIDWGFMDWAKEPVGAYLGMMSNVPLLGQGVESALGDSFLTRTKGYKVGQGVGKTTFGAGKIAGGVALTVAGQPQQGISMIGQGVGDVGEGVGGTVGNLNARSAMSDYNKQGYVSGKRLESAAKDFNTTMGLGSKLFDTTYSGINLAQNPSQQNLNSFLSKKDPYNPKMRERDDFNLLMNSFFPALGKAGAGIKQDGGYLNNYQEGGMVSMPEDFEIPKFKKGGLTPKKAREILHDKSVHGNPLTDKQRKYFGYISSQKKSSGGWLDEL